MLFSSTVWSGAAQYSVRNSIGPVVQTALAAEESQKGTSHRVIAARSRPAGRAFSWMIVSSDAGSSLSLTTGRDKPTGARWEGRGGVAASGSSFLGPSRKGPPQSKDSHAGGESSKASAHIHSGEERAVQIRPRITMLKRRENEPCPRKPIPTTSGNGFNRQRGRPDMLLNPSQTCSGSLITVVLPVDNVMVISYGYPKNPVTKSADHGCAILFNRSHGTRTRDSLPSPSKPLWLVCNNSRNSRQDATDDNRAGKPVARE